MRQAGGFVLAALLAATTQLRGQPIDVVSALGPAIEAELLSAAVEARGTYAALGLGLRKADLPVVIIAVPNVVELAPYLGAVGRSRAFSFAGADRNYILVAWEASGSPLRAVAHEYAHLTDPRSEAPLWFREGFAEYLSYLERDQAGNWVEITPAVHLLRLRSLPWLSLGDVRGAVRGAQAFQAPTFYAQSWLLTHWLMSYGVAPAALRPEDLDARIEGLGDQGLEAALRASLATMTAAEPDETRRPWTVAPAPEADWRVRLALAEVDRELGRRERSHAAFERLDAERADEPQVAAARGALAMDAGSYDEAEPLLARAAADTRATARTHYRLALLLLRPAENHLRERAREAASHARKALAQVPSSPDYRLALAQALMVDEAWDASARELDHLAGDPEWAVRASVEREELVRRRQQVINSVERPVFRPDIATLPSHRSLAVDPVPLPPAPARPAAAPPMRWPPPGSSIAVGRIDYVDCSGPEKIIVMRHPLLRLRFRERKGKPARLFLSPEKSWTEIPCGAKGWNVNIAYYNSRNSKDITGDAVAILF